MKGFGIHEGHEGARRATGEGPPSSSLSFASSLLRVFAFSIPCSLLVPLRVLRGFKPGPICVHLRSSAVSTFALFVAVLGLAAGGVRADTVMLADGQPLVGELQAGETAGGLRLVRFGETPLGVKREDILAIDFGRVRAEPAPITVTLHSGDRVSGAVHFGAGPSVTVQRAAGPLQVPLSAVATVRLKRDATLPAAGSNDVVLLGN